MKVVNLTPHDLVLVREDGSQVNYPRSGAVARATEAIQPIGELDGFPVVSMSYVGTVGLPGPEPGTVYAVSGFVAQAAPDRTDLVCPDTGPYSSVRDSQGRIIGVRRWCRFVGVEEEEEPYIFER